MNAIIHVFAPDLIQLKEWYRTGVHFSNWRADSV